MKGKINMKRYFQVLGICLAVLLVGLLGGLGFGFWQPATEEGLLEEEIATVESADGKINVLLMGLDEGGLRTDCIMVGSYDTETKEARLLSIPRDTRMYVGSKYQKINAAHAIRAQGGGIMGAQGTVEAVTRLTGIPINYYVELPFTAVAECIDLLGPVTYEIPDLYGDGVGMVYDDPYQDLHINLKPGVQELNGDQVVQLLRYRKGNRVNGVRKMYANGDIGRIAVQQEFFKALIDQKLNASLILKIPAIFKQLSDSIKTNLTVKDVVKYSKHLTGFNAENLQAFSLPGDSGTLDGASYWLCDLSETRVLIETEFGYDASKITIEKNAKATVAPAKNYNSSESKATSKPYGASSGTNENNKKQSSGKNTSASSTSKPKTSNTPVKTSTSDEDDEDLEDEAESNSSDTEKKSSTNSEKTSTSKKTSAETKESDADKTKEKASEKTEATVKPKQTEKPEGKPAEKTDKLPEKPEKTSAPVKQDTNSDDDEKIPVKVD